MNDYTPSQAEGDVEEEGRSAESLREVDPLQTPSQAEGEREEKEDEDDDQ
jgi:hypothetical protein